MARISRTAQRELEVLELRLGGCTFAEIARTVGYSNAGGAQKAFNRAMAREGAPQTSQQERVLEIARLEALWSAIWPAASRGDLTAVREASRLSDRLCRLKELDTAGRRTGGGDPYTDRDDVDRDAVVVNEQRLKEKREQHERAAAERRAAL